MSSPMTALHDEEHVGAVPGHVAVDRRGVAGAVDRVSRLCAAWPKSPPRRTDDRASVPISCVDYLRTRRPSSVIGYTDDAVIVVLVLRAVVRRAGPEAIRRHWPGTTDGLTAVQRLAGIT